MFGIKGLEFEEKTGLRELRNFGEVFEICEEILKEDDSNKNALALKAYYFLSCAREGSDDGEKKAAAVEVCLTGLNFF